MRRKYFASLAILSCLCLPAAGEIIAPIAAVSATGNLSARPIEEAINGNGLSGGGTSGDILSETHNVNSANSGQYWIGTVSGAALTFTLPAPSTVDTLHLWGYSRTGETDRGMKSFDLSFSTDGGATFDSLPKEMISGVAIGNFPNPITVQSFSFSARSGVTDIRFDNIVNYGDPQYTGLSEIRFGGSTGGSVPLRITEIGYSPDAAPNATVTLTWVKSGAAVYVARVSRDLTDWSSDLDDSISPERDENAEDADHMTVTFGLTGDLANEVTLFFRIEEG